jgi:hypothetical protein
MVDSENGTSSDNEENLYVIGEEFAVPTAYYDNEGDVLSCCSFILLFTEKQARQKRHSYNIYVEIASFFSCNNRLSASCD